MSESASVTQSQDQRQRLLELIGTAPGPFSLVELPVGARGPQRPIFALREPALVKEVFLDRADEFTTPQHPYLSLAGVLPPSGREVLKFTRETSASPDSIDHAVLACIERVAPSTLGEDAVDLLFAGLGFAALSAAEVIFGIRAPGDPLAIGESFVAQERALVTRRVEEGQSSGKPVPALQKLMFALWEAIPDSSQAASARKAMMPTLLNATFAAGLTLMWAVYECSRLPAAREALREEWAAVRNALRRGEPIPRLVGASSFIRETLRLNPPPFLLSRTAMRATEVAGISVPPGALLMVSPYHMQRDPRFWSDPDKFIPDRPEWEKPIAGTYLPFGFGPRRCVSSDFAMRELSLALVSLFGRFDIQVEDPTHMRTMHLVAMRPDPGPRARFFRL